MNRSIFFFLLLSNILTAASISQASSLLCSQLFKVNVSRTNIDAHLFGLMDEQSSAYRAALISRYGLMRWQGSLNLKINNTEWAHVTIESNPYEAVLKFEIKSIYNNKPVRVVKAVQIHDAGEANVRVDGDRDIEALTALAVFMRTGQGLFGPQ